MASPNTPARDPEARHLTVRTDRRLIRAHARSERFLVVEVVAPTAPPDPGRRRPPVNLAFVLDRSGSMSSRDKLPLARRAIDEAIARLDPGDRFAVVAYDDRIDTVLEGSPASPEARRLAAERLAAIDARGSTNLAGGWMRGCEQVALDLREQGVNRVLLLTDGLANVGITDADELAAHASELRARGVATSTFGVGTDFDERLLAGMADAGGGHFYLIANEAQIRDLIASEVGETLEVTARDVVVEITAPESVRVDTMSAFRLERRGSRTLVHLGDMVSGQQIRIVLRLTFDFGEVGREVGAMIGLADRDGAFGREAPALVPASVAWTYADHAANDRQERDRVVDRAVGRTFAARAQEEAVRLNRVGRYEEASAALEGVRRRIAAYAGSDPELNAIVDELRTEMPVFSTVMPEMDRKQRHFASYAMRASRAPDGRSTRS